MGIVGSRARSYPSVLQTVALATWLCRRPIGSLGVYTESSRTSRALAIPVATPRRTLRLFLWCTTIETPWRSVL